MPCRRPVFARPTELVECHQGHVIVRIIIIDLFRRRPVIVGVRERGNTIIMDSSAEHCGL